MRRDRERDRLHLLHMYDAANLALEVAQDRHRSELHKDTQFQLALVKAVELVGESAYQVSEQLKAENPDIPWQDIVDMRHVLGTTIGVSRWMLSGIRSRMTFHH